MTNVTSQTRLSNNILMTIKSVECSDGFRIPEVQPASMVRCGSYCVDFKSIIEVQDRPICLGERRILYSGSDD